MDFEKCTIMSGFCRSGHILWTLVISSHSLFEMLFCYQVQIQNFSLRKFFMCTVYTMHYWILIHQSFVQCNVLTSFGQVGRVNILQRTVDNLIWEGMARNKLKRSSHSLLCCIGQNTIFIWTKRMSSGCYIRNFNFIDKLYDIIIICRLPNNQVWQL